VESIQNVHARSGSVIINGDVAVLSFLASIDGHPNVAISMSLHVLEQLQSRITRALSDRAKPSPQE
jgi:hypothetical protein